MSLSSDARYVLTVAMANAKYATEIADAIDADSAAAPVAAHVAPVSAPAATDLTTAEALANANKTAINAVIASLIAAGLMAAS